MALQIIPGGLWIPHPFIRTGAISFGNMLIDASGEKAAGIFRAPKTGTVSKIGFLTGIVTTGATVDVRLETVDLANGDPSGTLFGTDSNGSQVIANGDDNTWFTTTLTTGPSVTKGDLLAVVIANAGSGDMNIRNCTFDNPRNFPYTDLFTLSWSKDDDAPVFSLEYSDGSYAYSLGVWPISATNSPFFNLSSTPDERGLIFQLPFPFRVTGMWINSDLDGAVDIVLYDDDGTTVLESVSLDPDVRQIPDKRTTLVWFDGTQTLSANTNYRLVLKPTTTTNVALVDFEVDSVVVMESLEGGSNFHFTERTDAGSWTDTVTKRPAIGLICDAFDDGVSVGGGDTVGNVPHQVVMQTSKIVSY